MSIFTIMTYATLTLVVGAGFHSLWHQQEREARPLLPRRTARRGTRRLARSRA